MIYFCEPLAFCTYLSHLNSLPKTYGCHYIYRTWTKLNTDNQRKLRDHPGLCTYNNSFLVVGGSENRESLNHVESIDWTTNTWTRWTSQLNIGREGPGVIQVGNNIYVIGGRGLEAKGTVEVWDSPEQPGGWFINPDIQVKHHNQEYSVVLLESSE